MNTYVQFMFNDIDCLGSDGVFILDGRNKLSTMIYNCKVQMKRLRQIKEITSFKIVKSDRYTDNKSCIIYTGKFNNQKK